MTLPLFSITDEGGHIGRISWVNTQYVYVDSPKIAVTYLAWGACGWNRLWPHVSGDLFIYMMSSKFFNLVATAAVKSVSEGYGPDEIPQQDRDDMIDAALRIILQ